MSGQLIRGRGWRGQYRDTDHVARSAEMARQRWVYEVTEIGNEYLALNPQAEYESHRAAYEETGNLAELRLALEYVTL